jgi:ABC-type thiamine transport system ATPase subunit
MSAQELDFLTAAHSQVRFNVGVRNFRFEVFLVDSRMATCRGASTSGCVYLMAVIALFARWASSR